MFTNSLLGSQKAGRGGGQWNVPIQKHWAVNKRMQNPTGNVGMSPDPTPHSSYVNLYSLVHPGVFIVAKDTLHKTYRLNLLSVQLRSVKYIPNMQPSPPSIPLTLFLLQHWNLVPIKHELPHSLPPPALGNHFLFPVSGFGHSKYLMWVESYSVCLLVSGVFHLLAVPLYIPTHSLLTRAPMSPHSHQTCYSLAFGWWPS